MKRKIGMIILALTLSVAAAGCGSSEQPKVHEINRVVGENQAGTEAAKEAEVKDPGMAEYSELLEGKYTVLIKVENYGDITVELDADAAPITVTNFMKLVNDGYYNGLTFHRIIEGFMMQGGENRNNPTGKIKGEFAANGVENAIKHERGTISMARANNPDSADSQFFICHQDSDFLDGQYAAFGHVVSGMDVVDKICEEAVVTDNNGTVPAEYQPVIASITEVTEK